MKSLKVPAVQDIARIIASTDDETVEALVEYYSHEAGFFNYGLSQKLARLVFAHLTPLELAIRACDRERTEGGRNQNREVIQFLWEAGRSRDVTPYELRPKVFQIRQDIQIKVSPVFYFVEGGKVRLFWLQPRRHYALSDAQLGLLASIVKMTFLVDDFENVGLELLDLSVPVGGKRRSMRKLDLDVLPLSSTSQVEELLQRFARAYDVVRSRGIEQKRRPTKRRSTDPDLFER